MLSKYRAVVFAQRVKAGKISGAAQPSSTHASKPGTAAWVTPAIKQPAAAAVPSTSAVAKSEAEAEEALFAWVLDDANAHGKPKT